MVNKQSTKPVYHRQQTQVKHYRKKRDQGTDEKHRNTDLRDDVPNGIQVRRKKGVGKKKQKQEAGS